MRTLGVICARGGSKGLPGKNMAMLNGKSMLDYSIEAARESRLLGKLIVSSDDPVIIEHVHELKNIDFCKRPAELATDDARIEGALLHALSLEEQEHGKYSIVVLLQNSSPLRTGGDIDNCIKLLHSDPTTDSVATVHRVHDYQWTIGTFGHLSCTVNDHIAYRRQDMGLRYVMNGVCYAVRRDYLVKNERVIADLVIPYEIPAWRAVDVHDAYDLIIAEALLKNG